CSRLFQHNSEQSLLVEAPQVGSKRLGLANHRRVTGKGLPKGSESPIGINIIDDNRSARPQGCESPIDLKAHVLFTMLAVVNKNVYLAKFGNYAREAPLARSPDIGPARPQSVDNRYADFFLPKMLQRRKVNTPQMSNPVPFKRLDNKTRCDSVSDPGLDNVARP